MCFYHAGENKSGSRFGGGTLIDHYWYVNSLSESGKYSTRGRDKYYTTRLQKATQFVENYQNDPEGHLQIIDPYNMEFLVRSQTNQDA